MSNNTCKSWVNHKWDDDDVCIVCGYDDFYGTR